MHTIVELPARLPDELAARLAAQQRERSQALRRLATLRREASAEIDRLLAFLDETDGYSTTEIEPNGDERDAAWREGLFRLSPNLLEDDEDGADDEPSLGSNEIREAGAVSYLPSYTRGGFYDAEEQSDDEGVTA